MTLEAAADVVEDEGGQGLLIPILLGLIVVLLGALLFVLARKRREDDRQNGTDTPSSEATV